MRTVERGQSNRTRKHKGKVERAYRLLIARHEFELERWMKLLDEVEARYGMQTVAALARKQAEHIRRKVNE